MSTKKEIQADLRLANDELVETTEELDGLIEKAKYLKANLDAENDESPARQLVVRELKSQLKDLFGDL